MTPGNFDTLFTVIGILALSGFSLIAIKIVIGAWLKRKELSAGGDNTALLDAIEASRTENRAMHDQLSGELSELHERIDFAERLLARGPYGRADDQG